MFASCVLAMTQFLHSMQMRRDVDLQGMTSSTMSGDVIPWQT